MKNVYDIIKRPVITEQSMESVADKKYVFEVDINANKTEIKEAVEAVFGVKVAKINTVRMQGKVKRTGAYPAGRRHDVIWRLRLKVAKSIYAISLNKPFRREICNYIFKQRHKSLPL